MTSTPHYIGLKEFVEGFARTLSRAPLKPDYRNGEALRRWLVPVVKAYLADKLGQQDLPYELRQRRSRGKRVIDPFPVLGAAFAPDFTIDVADVPTLAILSTLANDEKTLATKIGSAVGQAIVLAHQYPAVISFVLHRGREEEYQRWPAKEIQLDLWSRHKVMLVIREQPLLGTS